jgi:hypothetical protein
MGLSFVFKRAIKKCVTASLTAGWLLYSDPNGIPAMKAV